MSALKLSARQALKAMKPEFRFKRVRLRLTDGTFRVFLEGGDLISVELLVLHCGDSLDLTLPLCGTIPVEKELS